MYLKYIALEGIRDRAVSRTQAWKSERWSYYVEVGYVSPFRNQLVLANCLSILMSSILWPGYTIKNNYK